MMGRVIDDGVTLTTNPTSAPLPDDDPSLPDGSDDGDKSVPGDVDRCSDQADASRVTTGEDAEPNPVEGPALIPGDG